MTWTLTIRCTGGLALLERAVDILRKHGTSITELGFSDGQPVADLKLVIVSDGYEAADLLCRRLCAQLSALGASLSVERPSDWQP